MDPYQPARPMGPCYRRSTAPGHLAEHGSGRERQGRETRTLALEKAERQFLGSLYPEAKAQPCLSGTPGLISAESHILGDSQS